VIGATSTIAEAIARRFASQGAALCLVARNPVRLRTVADDLLVRGASKAEMLCADLTQFEQHEALIAAAVERLEEIDTVLVAHGVLGDQKAGEADYREADLVLATNFLSVVSLLTPLANYFERRGAGCIAVISSVAGDRCRRSNYIYGSSKAGLNAFLDGLRCRLHPRGVSVITVKPGLVDTAMTAHLSKTRLFAKPKTIALGVQRAMLSGKDVAYLPGFWAPVMLIIRMLPRFIFKRITV
jgi:decaprenylphospho-beta-D-erythro-pentofuranosid-2-ulose 2-reductase